MREKLSNLIDVKSIITILTTIVFCILVIFRNSIPQEFLTIYTTVIAFYFGTQVSKTTTAENTDATGVK